MGRGGILSMGVLAAGYLMALRGLQLGELRGKIHQLLEGIVRGHLDHRLRELVLQT